MADSEECYSESTASSTHEAVQQTLMSEEIAVIEQAFEEDVVMADVQWCLPNLAETQQSEVVSQFTLDCTDGHEKLVEHEYSSDELVKPKTSGPTQTLVGQQSHGFARLFDGTLIILYSTV